MKLHCNAEDTAKHQLSLIKSIKCLELLNQLTKPINATHCITRVNQILYLIGISWTINYLNSANKLQSNPTNMAFTRPRNTQGLQQRATILRVSLYIYFSTIYIIWLAEFLKKLDHRIWRKTLTSISSITPNNHSCTSKSVLKNEIGVDYWD